MVLPYDLTVVNATNTNNILDAFIVVNNNSDGILGILILIAIFIGYLFMFGKEQKLNDILASSFLTSIAAILMLLIGLISWQATITIIMILFIVFIIKWWID
jgi:hypothetical protein